MDNTCPLCAAQSEVILWQDARCRVILVNDPDYPGYCRAIWNAHVKEMTDLPEPDRAHFMSVVLAVESVLRELLTPEKINLASLGNQTPHLHWHVIPRHRDDAHFPNPIWSARLRKSTRNINIDASLLIRQLTEQLASSQDDSK
ncbi:MAG: HIT family protein [Gammaproteobacteria bacterium]|nr:HIT family protein [Gammaproteobacteria bacterium]